MRALTYHGANDVRVDNVPDPIIEQEDDIILRVTATAICGSDLHLYRGKIPGKRTGNTPCVDQPGILGNCTSLDQAFALHLTTCWHRI